MNKSGKLLLYICMFLATASLFAQNASDSRILNLFDDTVKAAFFNVYAEQNGEEILLWDNQSRDSTSKWLISIDGKIVKFKKSNWNKIMKENENKYSLSYNEPEFEMEQVLVFQDDRQNGSIKMIFTNNSDSSVNLRSSILLDTYIGEESNVPFRVSDDIPVTTETEFLDQNVPEWISMSDGGNGISLFIGFNLDLPVTPKRLVLANYYRLNSQGFNHRVINTRNFDNIHYKGQIDSAILTEYKSVDVPVGRSVEFEFFFGFEKTRVKNKIPVSNTIPKPQSEPDTIPEAQSNTEAQELQLEKNILYERQQIIDALLEEINALIQNQSELTEESVRVIESRVHEQEQLRREYETPQ